MADSLLLREYMLENAQFIKGLNKGCSRIAFGIEFGTKQPTTHLGGEWIF